MNIVRLLLALGIAAASADPEAAGGEDGRDGIRNIHGKKLADLREAILPMVEESLQKLLSPNGTSISPLATPETSDINDELIDIVKDDAIGNFDQITIERDEDGTIMVTKTKRVFADGRKHSHNVAASMAGDSSESSDRPRLKNVQHPGRNRNGTEREEDEDAEVEEDENAFIQNEQLITICLAALGVTSTGLLMWIAIQHLYGIYTDFKKTINPHSYAYDSHYSEEYDCTSELSTRMANRPPTYDHSQEVHCRDPNMQRHSVPAPPYNRASTSQEHRYETGSLDLNIQHQMSYNSAQTGLAGGSESSSWESDDEQFYRHHEVQAATEIHNCAGRRTLSLPPVNLEENLQRRFALRRRMERFRRRRQSVRAITQNAPASPANHVVCIPNFRSISQPAEPLPNRTDERDHVGEADRISTTSLPAENDFESAPELAELDFIHRILSRPNSRILPRRTTSYARYVDRRRSQNGSIVSVMNVQIEIEVPTQPTCQVNEIDD